mmetsp:Transcript_11592/g.34363  ORF Transcript_11592/g.34363 Transcript_11592/m.34363 type:complete len:461 (+) Transcript_11592:357-1739(+)
MQHARVAPIGRVPERGYGHKSFAPRQHGDACSGADRGAPDQVGVVQAEELEEGVVVDVEPDVDAGPVPAPDPRQAQRLHQILRHAHDLEALRHELRALQRQGGPVLVVAVRVLRVALHDQGHGEDLQQLHEVLQHGLRGAVVQEPGRDRVTLGPAGVEVDAPEQLHVAGAEVHADAAAALDVPHLEDRLHRAVGGLAEARAPHLRRGDGLAQLAQALGQLRVLAQQLPQRDTRVHRPRHPLPQVADRGEDARGVDAGPGVDRGDPEGLEVSGLLLDLVHDLRLEVRSLLLDLVDDLGLEFRLEVRGLLLDLVDDLGEVDAHVAALVHGLDHGLPDLLNLLPHGPELVEATLHGAEVDLPDRAQHARAAVAHDALQRRLALLDRGVHLLDRGGQRGEVRHLERSVPLRLLQEGRHLVVQLPGCLLDRAPHLHEARPRVGVGPHHGGVEALQLLEDALGLHL